MLKVSLFQLSVLEIHSILEYNYNRIITDWPYPFLAIPIQKSVDKNLFILNWYQHEKSQAISLICFGDFVLLKILQSDSQRAFWPISKE